MAPLWRGETVAVADVIDQEHLIHRRPGCAPYMRPEAVLQQCIPNAPNLGAEGLLHVTGKGRHSDLGGTAVGDSPAWARKTQVQSRRAKGKTGPPNAESRPAARQMPGAWSAARAI